MGSKQKETPLMKQYYEIKAKYPGALLLFRVGDFYETFGEDAINASRILDIVLTKRGNGSATEVELAGFPHHALDNYLPKLVKSGQRVAICDQLEDPKSVKGIVKRGVTELVTPGLSLNDNVLERKFNNYLASVSFTKEALGVSFLDLSTGEFLTTKGNESYVSKLIQSFNPSEIIYPKSQRKKFYDLFGEEHHTFTLEEWIYNFDFTYEKLTSHFGTPTLKGFGIEGMDEAIMSAGAILHYLEVTEHREVGHISSISRIQEDQYVWLDKFTIRNLELVYPQHDGGIPLIDILDNTRTPMGSRLLKRWMVLPLKDTHRIAERHSIVEQLLLDRSIMDALAGHLKNIGDLERLAGKIAVGRVNPRELVTLKKALMQLAPIKEVLANVSHPAVRKIADRILECKELIAKIENEIKDDAPMLIHQGNIIKDGIDADLDEYRSMAYKGKDVLLGIQKREAENTGITSLKIAYNKVFGYYLEVSNAHKDKVPQEWIRKQTLVNAERYITEELKIYEEKILTAEDKLGVIEQDLYRQIVAYSNDYVETIQENAKIIAQIDCLLGFAERALQFKYCKPIVDDSFVIDINEGRHPVIERLMPPGEKYVPNSIKLDKEEQQIIIITGPNMAGKSALLRQTALIVLMAQMGSFVPAKSAKIGMIDKVFTRVGASDNLSRGESTFMVEMTETASILNNLSDRSLVLMDEIGRGTSTYDGVSIAWSIVEYLNNHPQFKPKTLFATHYHELNQLETDLEGIANYNVSVKEVGDKILFMRKLKKGGSEHSFGIHVAQLAGMPNQVIIRASEIMHFLEKDRRKTGGTGKKMKDLPKSQPQMSLFQADDDYLEVKNMLEKLDINRISPVEALLKLNEIKNKISG